MGDPADMDPRVVATRARVLRQARDLLIDEGVAAVTFDGVSRRTGVSRTTLYRHWARPIDLLIEAWEQLTRPATLPHTASLRADLVATFTAARDGLEYGEWRQLLPSLVAAAESDPDLARLHARFTDDRRAPVLTRLRAAQSAGELRAGADLELAVDTIAGVLFYRRLLRHCPTPDDIITRTVDTVLAQLI